jgi:WS/DGAT/MGAT family acyltransferase
VAAIQQLSPQDAQFLYLQGGNILMHVMGVNIYAPSTAAGKKLGLDDVVRFVESRLDCSPVFRRRLQRLPYDFDHPYWVEDEFFDIGHHVFHTRLPRPGSWKQFRVALARHFSRPMDMSRPLWDMYVIEGLNSAPDTPRGAVAVAFRIHHAACDGASIRHLFHILSDRDARGTPALPLPASRPEPDLPPSAVRVAQRALVSNLRNPARFASTLVRYLPSILGAAGRLLTDRNTRLTRVPHTRFNRAISPHKRFDVAFMGLEDLKRVKARVEGATLNDVILAVCGGAVRRYLAHHDELPKRSLVALAPVSQKRPGEDFASGNDLTAMPVPLATDVENPLERLRLIHEATLRTKAAKAGISTRLMADLTKHVPALVMSGTTPLMRNSQVIQKICNLLVSNVPGPPEPLYLGGARMLHNFGLAPVVDGMGLFIAVGSYAGEMTFTVISNQEILPDIEYFRECLEESLQELQAER